jgi:hypothetical protein
VLGVAVLGVAVLGDASAVFIDHCNSPGSDSIEFIGGMANPT